MPESATLPQSEPSQADGTPSTESSMENSNTLSWRDKLKAWTGISAVKSITRGMATEDKQAKRDADFYHGALSTRTNAVTEPTETDEVGDTVLGNQTVTHQHFPAPEPPKRGMGGLAKAAIGLGVLAGTCGLGLAALPLIKAALTPDAIVTPGEPGKTIRIPGEDTDFRILAPKILP
jgi:hypothetical protein